MGLTGSPFMKTPNLDRIGREGARLAGWQAAALWIVALSGVVLVWRIL